jgi:hypothetical protein
VKTDKTPVAPLLKSMATVAATVIYDAAFWALVRMDGTVCQHWERLWGSIFVDWRKMLLTGVYKMLHRLDQSSTTLLPQ